MGKIKVLQFPMTNSGGGITQYALNNWKYIDHERFQFDFATMNPVFHYEKELNAEGCKVHHIRFRSEENDREFTREINDILNEGYDAVHLHTLHWKSFRMEEICMQRKVPKVIVHSHNTMVDILDDAERDKILRHHLQQKEAFSKEYATDFWACSKVAADWLFGSRVPKDEIKVMNNAIDTERYRFCDEIRQIYRKNLNIQNDFVIGHVGRFVYQKNHDFLLKTFAEVCKEIPNAKLMLIGTGMLEEQIRHQALEYNILDKILFLGRRDDVEKLFQAMDLFVLPSRFEGLPIVLVEAQTAGLKCLMSDTITDEVMITKNITSMELDEKKWKDAIIKEGTTPYFREDMKAIIAEKGYDIHQQIKRIEAGYMGV